MKTKLLSIITLCALALTTHATLSRDDKNAWNAALKTYAENGTSPDEKAKVNLITLMLAAAEQGEANNVALALNHQIDASGVTARNKAIRHSIVNTILAQDSTFVPPNDPSTPPSGQALAKYAAPALVIGEIHVRNVPGFPAGRTDIPGYGSFNGTNKFVLIPAKSAGFTPSEADSALDRTFGNGNWLDGSGANSVPLSVSSGTPDGQQVGTLFARFYVIRYADSAEPKVLESDGVGGPEALAVEGKDYTTFGEAKWNDGIKDVIFKWYQSTSPFKPEVKGDDDFIRPAVVQ